MADDEGSIEWTSYMWLFVGCAFVFLIGRNWGTFDAFPINWFVVLLIILGYFSSEGIIWSSRYGMSHFSCDGAQGSFNLNHGPVEIVDSYVDKDGKEEQFTWLVYGLGAYNFPLPGKGKLETVIVPKQQVDTRSKNHQSKTKVSPVSLASISMFPRLYTELGNRKDSFNLEKIKIGWHLSGFKYKDLGDLDLEAQMNRMGAYTDMLNQVANDKFDKFEEVKELFERMTQKPGILDRVGSFFRGSSSPQES